MTDLWGASAHQMLEALGAGTVSSEELVRQCLARISAVNPTLNAIVVDNAEAALEEARAVDVARGRGQELGPLAGLPFTAKLDYDVAGQATSQGSVLMRDAIATSDGPMISRMRAAGAVLIGRTNEPDFGVTYHTTSSLYGLTRNPWNLNRSPGGSSGGEAAAVASGMSPLGLGSDFGGSIRSPASFNGVAGFKPSLGRYPDHVESAPERGIDEQLFTARGPLARSVQDLLIADRVLRGIDPIDPWTAPWLDAHPAPGRVGVIYAPTDGELPEGIFATVGLAVEALRATGHQVEETKLAAWPELANNYAEIALADFGGDSTIWESFPEETQRFLAHVHSLLEENAGSHEADLGAALARRYRLAVEFNKFHENYDLLLMPTWCDLPFLSDSMRTGEGIDASLAASRHLCIFNLLGLPAMSMPAAIVDGLPVGVHLSSLRHRDETVLRAGLDIESQLGTFTPVAPN